MFQHHASREATANYAAALVSGSGAILYRYTRGGLVRLNSMTTKLQKKQRKGGQSAQRIGRLRQEKRMVWLKRILTSLDNAFLDASGQATIDGLVLAGPSTLKAELVSTKGFGNTSSHSALLHQLPRSAVHLLPTDAITSGKTSTVLQQVREAIPLLFRTQETDAEQSKLADFDDAMDTGTAIFGPAEVRAALASCDVREVLVAANDDHPHGLDEWDALCVDAGATLSVVSCLAFKLDDYQGVVGVRWFPKAVDVDCYVDDHGSDGVFTPISTVAINAVATSAVSPSTTLSGLRFEAAVFVPANAPVFVPAERET